MFIARYANVSDTGHALAAGPAPKLSPESRLHDHSEQLLGGRQGKFHIFLSTVKITRKSINNLLECGHRLQAKDFRQHHQRSTTDKWYFECLNLFPHVRLIYRSSPAHSTCWLPMVDNPEELALMFATTVTSESENRMDCVARNGDNSIFALLCMTFPEVRSHLNIDFFQYINPLHKC